MTDAERQQIVDKAMDDSTSYLKRLAIEALVTLDTMTDGDGSLTYPHGYLVQCGLEGKSRVLDILMRFIPTPTERASQGKPSVVELADALENNET